MVDTTNSNELEIINDWINANFPKSNDYRGCLNKMDYLNDFLNKYHCNLKYNTITELLNNNSIFRSYIETIFKHNKLQIERGSLDELFENDLLINSIDVYCIINDIKIADKYVLTNTMLSDSLNTYYMDIKDIDLLSFKEEQELARRIKNGDSEAKEKFIKANLKLVVYVAKNYMNKGLPMQDLIQEGNIGLMIAVDKFDPDKRFKFSTYAHYWIKQSIARAIGNYSRTIRIPIHILDKYRIYINRKEALAKVLKREPTVEELSQKLSMTIKEINDLSAIQKEVISLDAKMTEDNDNTLVDFIPDSSIDIEEKVLFETLPTDVVELLENSHLDEREKNVIIYRFGLDGGDVRTLEEVGNIFDITRERVRQIEAAALRKLRGSELLVHFDEYDRQPKDVKNRLEALRRTMSFRYSASHSHYSMISYCQNGKTIYDYFMVYSREEVDNMIKELSSEEKELLTKRYGNDLNVRYTSILNANEKIVYYRKVLDKMKKILIKNHKYLERMNKEFSTNMINGNNIHSETDNNISKQKVHIKK